MLRNIFRPLFAVIGFVMLAQAALAASHPLNIGGAESTDVGILIMKLDNDSVLLEVNADRFFVPASVMKSVTSATAMSLLDTDKCFETVVGLDGKIVNGVVDGNLVVEAVGDPTVESRHFPANLGFADSIAAAIVNLGVKKVKGSVIVEETSFLDPGIPAGWLNEDVIWPYGTGLYGANFRDNTISLSMPSGESVPHVPGLKVNHVAGKGGLSVKRDRNSSTFQFTGTVPQKGHRDTYANPAPGRAMAHEVETALKKAGIEVVNSKSVGHEAGHIDRVVYTHTSPTLKEILHSLMIRSDNMMAEGMLRAIAPGQSRADAVDDELTLWREAGLDVDGVVVEDGSGLSRKDRLSPRFLASLYKYMSELPDGRAYSDLFPRAGKEGTMRNFLKGTRLEGQVAMKTGSMRGVQGFGGYKLDNDGNPTHVIIFLINNFTCGRDQLKKEIQRVILEAFPE